MLKLTASQKESLLSSINKDMTVDELADIDDLHIEDQVDYCKSFAKRI